MTRRPLLLLLAACTSAPPDETVDDTSATVDTTPVDLRSGGPGDASQVTTSEGIVVFRAVDDRPALRGGGGPAVTFTEDQLFANCAPLPGGPQDLDHHNLVVPYHGHLVLPWCPEFGNGGISFFDVSDPCKPTKAGEGYSKQMRETHGMGFFELPAGHPQAGEYAVVNGMENPLAANTGIEIWDVGDPTAPAPVTFLGLEGSYYPDSYTLVGLHVFVQYPWVYVASAGAGIYVVDVSDPTAPMQAAHVTFDEGFSAGGVFALGTLLLVTGSEQDRAVLMDISDPIDPQRIPGGTFELKDSTGEPREAYHANLSGHYALFERKEGGGGPLMYDISDPTAPTYMGDIALPFMNGGYVFYDEGFLFTGDSNAGHVIDARDPSDMVVVGQGFIDGDLDTTTPYGNIALLAVDDPGSTLEQGYATQVMPWTKEPDSTPIEVLGTEPQDADTGVALTARIGVGFNEMVEPATVFPGTIRLFAADGEPVDGWTSVQEGTASYAPKQPLLPATVYTVEVVAGGAADVNGNALAETVTWSFTTAE